ncbi:MAG: AMP-binding protein [Spirochaetales bacterium]|nr:AMP-binding protein [Spirochaetales bacterium]
MTDRETVPKRIRLRSQQHADRPFSWTKDGENIFRPTSFAEMWDTVCKIGAGLASLGVRRGDHVGLMSHNRREWIFCDLAVLGLGAADVPRGADSTAEEMAYILAHADCRLVFAEDSEQCAKILTVRKSIPSLERIVLFDDYADPAHRPTARGIAISSYLELLDAGVAAGEEGRARFEGEVEAGDTDELATLLYTSGTTGEPKGVMLRHRSFLFQMDRIEHILFLTPRDIFITVLPIWHSFERAVEYICLNYGASLAYSKPIGTVMLDDMAQIRPTWMTSVPRIWEGIRAAVLRNVAKQSAVKQALFHFFLGVGEIHADLYTTFMGRLPRFQRRYRALDALVAAIPLALLTPLRMLGNLLVFKTLQARLGGRFVAGVSGGGALPPYVDKFFRAVGIKVLEGYGLTETGPVLAVRKQKAPVPGTVGSILPDVAFRVVDAGREVGPGEKGELYVKSEQVMEGYYKRPDETAKVLIDGWLNTGDLVIYTYDDELRIVGRSKETIVLLGGENIEPQPIEDAMLQSEYIEQVMVVGQDQKFLSALIHPNRDRMAAFAEEREIESVEPDELLENEQFRAQINREVQERVSAKTGFKSFEQVFRFHLLPRPFEVGEELTQTLKVKRAVVYEKYHREIAKLFA